MESPFNLFFLCLRIMGFKDIHFSTDNKNPPILKSLDLYFRKEDDTSPYQ